MNCTTHLRKDLRNSALDGFLFCVMVGAGETFFVAFALANGLSQLSAGLIAVMPFMVGAGFQLFSLSLLKRAGSYRKWVATSAALQGLCFFPLAVGALLGQTPSWILYLIFSLYWGFGMSSGPAWNSWMSSLVPRQLRAHYFAKRNHISQIGLILGVVCSGFLLEFAKQKDFLFSAFAILFFISGIARLVSAYFLYKQSEPGNRAKQQRRLSLREFFPMLRHSVEGRLFLFLILFQICVQVSAPYSNPFMLKQLNLSYLAYMGLVVTAMVSKILVFKALGKFSHKRGSAALLKLGMFGAAFTPLVWLFSDNYVFLIFCQAFNGAVWAAYELGNQLCFLEVVPERERTSFLSLYNVTNAGAIVSGSMVGAQALHEMGEVKTTYYIIYALSSVLRLGAFFLALRFLFVSMRRPLVRPGVTKEPSQAA